MYSKKIGRDRKKTPTDFDSEQKNTVKNHFKNQTSNFIQHCVFNRLFYLSPLKLLSR